MPAYINLSIEALKCHNDHFVHVELVTDRSFRTFAAASKFPLHPAFDGMLSAHKADYFRCTILLKYGGLYTDADMLHWNTFQPWFEKLTQGFDVIGYRWPGEIVGVVLIGPMKTGLALMRYWLRDVHLLLDAKAAAFRFPGKVDYPLRMGRDAAQCAPAENVPADERVESELLLVRRATQTLGLFQQTLIDRDLFKNINESDKNFQKQIATIQASEFPSFVYHNTQQAEMQPVCSDQHRPRQPIWEVNY